MDKQLPLELCARHGAVYRASNVAPALDFADVRGQEADKRAIRIDAAIHNLRMVGPLGTGQSGDRGWWFIPSGLRLTISTRDCTILHEVYQICRFGNRPATVPPL